MKEAKYSIFVMNAKMRIMDLDARKYEFIQKLFHVNESVFEELENVLKKGGKESQRISIDQYNQEIEESIAQIEKGKTYTHQEVGEHIKQWAKK